MIHQYTWRDREWLYWFDQDGNRLPTPEELAQQEQQRAVAAAQELLALRQKLQQRGIDPDTL
ncbi:MAG: hypothetical protein AAFX01_01620 [Cyanobacteria bacterium J06638_28]